MQAALGRLLSLRTRPGSKDIYHSKSWLKALWIVIAIDSSASAA